MDTAGFDRITLLVGVLGAAVITVVAFATGAVGEVYLVGALILGLLVALVADQRGVHEGDGGAPVAQTRNVAKAMRREPRPGSPRERNQLGRTSRSPGADRRGD